MAVYYPGGSDIDLAARRMSSFHRGAFGSLPRGRALSLCPRLRGVRRLGAGGGTAAPGPRCSAAGPKAPQGRHKWQRWGSEQVALISSLPTARIQYRYPHPHIITGTSRSGRIAASSISSEPTATQTSQYRRQTERAIAALMLEGLATRSPGHLTFPDR